MTGHRFSQYIPRPEGKMGFDELLKLLQQLLVYTSGDVPEALSWLTELDNQYQLTGPEYGIGDFIQELRDRGYLQGDGQAGGMALQMTGKLEQTIRRSSLEEIFGKLKRGNRGQHATPYSGPGEEQSADVRPYEFGDPMHQVLMTESLRNAQIQHGIGDFRLTERDLEVSEAEHKTQTATVLMIDISHSMILYGEDRITPAKKTAMALAELILTRYPKDTLDIIVFGNDAWPIEIRDLPYLQVGPYHTNTVAGLELALDLLRRRRTANKQIFMITDGKPTCLREPDGTYYKNSFGLDRRILGRTLNLAGQARRLGIPITTFMIARDPYLQRFVQEFTEVNHGRAFYSSLQGLGEYIFEDYVRNRRKTVR
jgi:uncharacterized protein with von Willebrand factor type A (vWA) domain